MVTSTRRQQKGDDFPTAILTRKTPSPVTIPKFNPRHLAVGTTTSSHPFRPLPRHAQKMAKRHRVLTLRLPLARVVAKSKALKTLPPSGIHRKRRRSLTAKKMRPSSSKSWSCGLSQTIQGNFVPKVKLYFVCCRANTLPLSDLSCEGVRDS